MEGLPDGTPTQEEPKQPVFKRLSFWELHGRNLPPLVDKGRDPLKGFCSTLQDLFQLDRLPDPAKSYCYAFEDSFSRVFSGFFQEIPDNGPVKKLHAQMLSGLVLKKIHSDTLYVVVRYCDTVEGRFLYMLRYELSRKAPDELLRDKSKHIKVPLSSLHSSVPLYQLVHFQPHTRVMTLGDQHKVEPERKSLRHKPAKGKTPKKARAGAGSSDSDAEPDPDEARADAETLRNTPEGRSQNRPRQTDGATGGASAASKSSAAGAPDAPAGASASQTLSEKDKEFLELAQDFHPDIVVQHLDNPDEFLAALQKFVKRRRAIDGVLPKDSTHSEILKDVDRLRKKRAQEGFLDSRSRALQKITEVDERQWALDQVFEDYVQKYYPSAPAGVLDTPQAQASEAADACTDKEKPRKPIRYARQLPRPLSEFKRLPDVPYRSLCFQHSSQDDSLLVLFLRKSMTHLWEKLFPGRLREKRDIRFAVLISLELYEKLPQHIRDLLFLEPTDIKSRGISHFLLVKVVEKDQVLDDDWMRRFCEADLPTLMGMCDEMLRERLTVDGKPFHEHIEARLLAVVHAQIRGHNDSVNKARDKREKRALKRRAIDEHNKTAPEGQKQHYKVYEDERYNGPGELPPLLELPDEVEVIFFPFILALVCMATNGRLEHGVGCPACGKDIVNPITGPLFHDYIKNNTHEAARRMKRTIPRYFLNGLCNCFPVCNTYKKPF